MFIKFFQKFSFFIFFIILTLIPVVSLFPTGLPITHDGQDHVARIANFYLNLTQGNFIPRWAENLNWGYGHPILMFLYPLPSYIASLFHFLGFSLVDSTKIVLGLGMVLSFSFMYLWLSKFNSKQASLFGAVLYSYAPYRFVDLYVRGDIGENLAFSFIPLVLFFVYMLYKKPDYKRILGGGISIALLILSHNAISLMFMPLIFLYGLMLIYITDKRKELIINLFLLFFVGFSLSAFFWVPALLEGKYTLRNIVTKSVYLSSFVKLDALFYGPWSYGQSGQFTVQFGLFQWVSLLFSPFLILNKFKDKQKSIFTLILIIFSIGSLFLMLPISNLVWSKILLLQNFQFPWRFLAIIVFTTSVLGALLVSSLPKKINKNYFVALSIIIILLVSFSYIKPRGYQQKNESFYTGIYHSTTDTGESAPIWSVRFMEHTPQNHLEVIDGHAKIKDLERTSGYHKYQLNVQSRTLFRENTLYFPGWEIRANGKTLNIQFQNKDYRGVMLFFLDKGNYIVETEFKETKLRALSDSLSVVILFNILGFLGYKFVKRYVY